MSSLAPSVYTILPDVLTPFHDDGIVVVGGGVPVHEAVACSSRNGPNMC